MSDDPKATRAEIVYRLAREEADIWAADLGDAGLSRAEAIGFATVMLSVLVARTIGTKGNADGAFDESVIADVVAQVRLQTKTELALLRQPPEEPPKH